MVCSLRRGDQRSSAIRERERTHCPVTCVFNGFGIAWEGLCDDGDLVSTPLLDPHGSCKPYHPYNTLISTRVDILQRRGVSPAPMTITCLGDVDIFSNEIAVQSPLSIDNRAGAAIGLCLTLFPWSLVAPLNFLKVHCPNKTYIKV
jgi:hypothetical protein